MTDGDNEIPGFPCTIFLINVVFPVPLDPIIAILSPPRILKLFAFHNTRPSIVPETSSPRIIVLFFTLSKFTKSILSGGSSFLFSTLSSFSSLVSRDFTVFRNFFCLLAKYGFVTFILPSDELKFFGFLVARWAFCSFIFIAFSNRFFSFSYFSYSNSSRCLSNSFCST